jgi:signal transduction histidine kinase
LAEGLSNTAREVMAGDLSRRAPVRGSGDEFDELAGSMNAMLDRLEQLMQTTRTAGDAIAHDLRSPLTRFRQKLEVALEKPADSTGDREALRNALDEADRLLDMFSAVLKLARVEAAGNWRFERVDVSEILRELVEFYEPAAEEQGRTLKGYIADGLNLNGEVGLFTQAVSNLIENALKYTPEGGHVEVRAVRRPDGRIEIDVLDDGPGVPPVERDRVLERFVRLETARTTPGVGLGLSLVAAVARLHHGGLHLRDGLGDGERKGLGAALVLPAMASR